MDRQEPSSAGDGPDSRDAIPGRADRPTPTGIGDLGDPGTSAANGRWDWLSSLNSARQGTSQQKPDGRPADAIRADPPPRRSLRKRDPMVIEGAIVSRPLISPRLRADPRWRIWISRILITVGIYLVALIFLDWRIALSITAFYLAADIVFRSKTMPVVPPGVRVTAAQHSTRRRLRLLRPAGYLALNARTVPGTQSVIDHVVVGPAGIFVVDSEKWDRRLTVALIDGVMYHGPANQKEKLDHSRWEARQAARLISIELGQDVRVRPVMIIYGPKIPWVITPVRGVDVFDGSKIGTYFRRQSKASKKHHIDAAQIESIFTAASRALPPLR